MADPKLDPRVVVDSYIVRPTVHDQIDEWNNREWSLEVVNGHTFGWAIKRAHYSGDTKRLNRKGQWIWETQGSKSNRFRRWELDEALAIALKYVDVLKVNRYTAAEYVAAHPIEAPGGP